VVGVLILLNVASLASLLSSLNGVKLGSVAVELVTLGLISVLLLLKLALKSLAEESLVALEHVIESIGRVSKGMTKLVKKGTKLSTKSRAVGTLVSGELIHGRVDLSSAEALRRLIGRTVHGLELHLDAAEEGSKITLFSNLASLLAATVLLESSNQAADALVITALGSLTILGITLADPLSESLGAAPRSRGSCPGQPS